MPVALNLERRQKMYGLVLREKYGIEGISRNDVIDLFDMLDGTEAYPIELYSNEQEGYAMGFITPKAADLVDYDYENSGLREYIASILDDMEQESKTCEYEFKGIKIWMSR